MSLRERILRPEEHHRLACTAGQELMLQVTHPGNVAVPVVERDGKILASLTVLQLLHFDGLWLDPEVRGDAGVLRKLLRIAYSLPEARGEEWVLSHPAYGDARALTMLGKLGATEIPVSTFALPMRAW